MKILGVVRLLLLFVGLLIPSIILAQAVDIRFFPGNEKYGFIKITNPKFPNPADYLIIRTIPVVEDKGVPYAIIDTVTSTIRPQLCDSNAISYIITRNDSAFLATSILWPERKKDTLISLIEPNGRICSVGENESYRLLVLNKLNRYCYLSKDSIMAWEFSVKEEFFAIGEINNSGNFNIFIFGLWANGPDLTNDFTQILFSVPSDKSITDLNNNGSRLLAYDIALKDTISLFESDRGFYGARKRCHDCAIYCIAVSMVDDGVDFCRIAGNSFVSLAHYTRPVAIIDYYLYSDSVVIRTSNCCDSTYGIKSQVIFDKER
jgi:hypothetical protein